MKFHFDITHPAHVHFFKFAIRDFQGSGHECVVTSRPKDVTIDLLDEEGIEHEIVGRRTRTKGGLPTELLARTRALATVLRRRKPHAVAAVGGIFAAYGARAAGIPSVVFYATETARVHNAMTFPVASRVVVPDCYFAWVPRSRTSRYAGCHELAYLRPELFEPDPRIARENGIPPDGPPTYLVRLVSWASNHDIGSAGLRDSALRSLVSTLEQKGRVMISSERSLPADLKSRSYQGNPKSIHHVIAQCHGVVGESSTMVAEGAVLGIPGVYIASQRRGFIEYLQNDFGLVRHVTDPESAKDSVDWLLQIDQTEFKSRRQRLLANTENVSHRIRDELMSCSLSFSSARTELPDA